MPDSEPSVNRDRDARDVVFELEAEVERLRRALRTIAHNDGGWAGRKAREVLHPERYAGDGRGS